LVYFYGDPEALKDIIAGSPNNDTLSSFVEQYKEESSFLYSYTALGLGALAAITFAAGSDSDDDPTKFTISGNISAGQVIEGHDLTLKVYDQNGDEVDAEKANKNSHQIRLWFVHLMTTPNRCLAFLPQH
jgi:hypothetical protein